MPSLRRIWLRVHRWVALTLGWILIVVGLTGAVLVVARPLDRWLHPQYFLANSVAAVGNASLESVHQRLEKEFGQNVAFTFRPPRVPGETLQVLVRSAWRGTLFFDPASGLEQGRRGDDEGFVNIVFKIHSSLWMNETGKALLAYTALAYLLLLISGFVVWWPKRWPPSLRLELRKGLLRGLFDVHRTGGAVLALAIAVSIATGAFLAWRPIGGWITALSGATRVQVPARVTGSGPTLPLDELATRARDAFPQGAVGYLMIPALPDRPLRVRMRLPDDPHPNGLTSVWLNPRTGDILGKYRWDELEPGLRINAVIYPLHTGELGGPLLETVVACLGLMLGVLGGSGIWLWWRRRTSRSKG